MLLAIKGCADDDDDPLDGALESFDSLKLRRPSPYQPAVQALEQALKDALEYRLETVSACRTCIDVLVNASAELRAWASIERASLIEAFEAREQPAMIAELRAQYHRYLFPSCRGACKHAEDIERLIEHNLKNVHERGDWVGGAARAEAEWLHWRHMYATLSLQPDQVPVCIGLLESTSDWLHPVRDTEEQARITNWVQQGEQVARDLGRQLHNHLFPACADWPTCEHIPQLLNLRASHQHQALSPPPSPVHGASPVRGASSLNGAIDALTTKVDELASQWSPGSSGGHHHPVNGANPVREPISLNRASPVAGASPLNRASSANGASPLNGASPVSGAILWPEKEGSASDDEAMMQVATAPCCFFLRAGSLTGSVTGSLACADSCPWSHDLSGVKDKHTLESGYGCHLGFRCPVHVSVRVLLRHLGEDLGYAATEMDAIADQLNVKMVRTSDHLRRLGRDGVLGLNLGVPLIEKGILELFQSTWDREAKERAEAVK